MQNIDKFYKKFKLYCKKNVNISTLTTFRIGGEAKLLCQVNSIRTLKKAVKFANKLKIKYFIIGNGSNILASDKGYDGIIFKLGDNFKKYKIRRLTAICGAGINLFVMNNILRQHGLGGAEFSYGIPATLGGAVAMNAGAFGSDFSKIVKWVKVLRNNRIIKIYNKKCGFDYRNSVFIEKNMIITQICLKLNKDEPTKIKDKQTKNLQWRRLHQPYTFSSAGSVFRRQNNFIPAKVIDELGLKGKRINDAQVSKIHAGFIVNLGSATCQDVLNLIFYIIRLVQNKFGITLELEIRLIGEGL